MQSKTIDMQCLVLLFPKAITIIDVIYVDVLHNMNYMLRRLRYQLTYLLRTLEKHFSSLFT